MYPEQYQNKIFTLVRNVFSSPEKSLPHDITHKSPVSVTVTEQKISQEKSVVTTSLTFTSRVSDESVTAKEIPLRTVGVTSPTYSLPDEKDLDIRFATKFIGAGGKFVFCESMKAAIDNLKILKQEQKWSHIFCWENEIKDAFNENQFQKGAIGFTIENSDAAISLCENLIADEGTIILNPKQASRRRLHCFPKTHIIVTDIAHLSASETAGLKKFAAWNKGELPSIIKLGCCNTGHFYDKQRLILNSEGTEDVYVFLVDEIIPPSLRP